MLRYYNNPLLFLTVFASLRLKAKLPWASTGAELKFRRANGKKSIPVEHCSTIFLSHTKWIYLVYRMHYIAFMYNRSANDKTWKKRDLENSVEKAGKRHQTSTKARVAISFWEAFWIVVNHLHLMCLVANNFIESAFDTGIHRTQNCTFASVSENITANYPIACELSHRFFQVRSRLYYS